MANSGLSGAAFQSPGRPDNKGTKLMMKLLKTIKTNESGASAAEYALIVAVLGGLVVAGTLAFGGSLSTALTNSGEALEEQAPNSFN
jgi:pilus assembly protein Flp/PilA